ncbi:uncharacterized protein LOC116434068 isoform X3 [Nomia melanderi]|uniref:uncharacterized protein LOC116434068 isoform X3 n=1 Tax=Nomia melanderi TaxID=2448451 RepID=UPI003FCE9B90
MLPQMHTLAEPRDNKDIFPPHGNLHKSSYQRLGPEAGATGISETRAMLSQIELKHLYKPIYPQRTFLNMKALASEVTTKEIDYRLPYPIKRKPPPPPPPPVPWLLNRRMIGYSLDELEKRDGFYTFLDDNMEVHRRIADLKSRRDTLYDLTTAKRSP